MPTVSKFVSIDVAANAGVDVEIDGKDITFHGLTYADLGACIRQARAEALSAWKEVCGTPRTPDEWSIHRAELNTILFGQYGQNALEFPLLPRVVREMMYRSVNKNRQFEISYETVERWCEKHELRDHLLNLILTLTAGGSAETKKGSDGSENPTIASSSPGSTSTSAVS